LHADADAEEGFGCGNFPNGLFQAGFAQITHAIRHRSLSGENDAVGRADFFGIR